MSMFTLSISWLNTANLPWFMDLTFQVPMQYYSLQHQSLLPSLATCTSGCWFCFGSISSFFLELYLHWFPVAYWVPTDLGRSSFSVLSFCLFLLFMGFSRQEYWSGLPFPSPVDLTLSDLSTMTCPSLVAPQAWLGFIELDKAMVLVWLDWLVFCEYGFSVLRCILLGINLCDTPLLRKDRSSSPFFTVSQQSLLYLLRKMATCKKGFYTLRSKQSIQHILKIQTDFFKYPYIDR